MSTSIITAPVALDPRLHAKLTAYLSISLDPWSKMAREESLQAEPAALINCT